MRAHSAAGRRRAAHARCAGQGARRRRPWRADRRAAQRRHGRRRSKASANSTVPCVSIIYAVRRSLAAPFRRKPMRIVAPLTLSPRSAARSASRRWRPTPSRCAGPGAATCRPPIRIRRTKASPTTSTRSSTSSWSSATSSSELVPALAESWTQVNPTTWRFKLRPGRQVPRRHAVHRRRRRVQLRARARRHVAAARLLERRRHSEEDRRPDGGVHDQRPQPDRARAHRHHQHHVEGVVREEQVPEAAELRRRRRT